MAAVKPLSLSPLPADTDVHLAVLADRLLRAVRLGMQQHDWGGLRPSHLRLLGHVPADGATITDLAEPLAMTKQAVGQFVTHLRGTGHLDLSLDPRDRRRRVVVRTALGDQAVAQVGIVAAAVEEHWAEQVGHKDYATFRRVLREVTNT